MTYLLTTNDLLSVIKERTNKVQHSLDNDLTTLEADMNSLKAAVNLINKVRSNELNHGVNTANIYQQEQLSG